MNGKHRKLEPKIKTSLCKRKKILLYWRVKLQNPVSLYYIVRSRIFTFDFPVPLFTKDYWHFSLQFICFSYIFSDKNTCYLLVHFERNLNL